MGTLKNQELRINLSNAIFPFHTDFEGRTIIVPQYDQNYNYIDQAGENVKDRGIPQAFYMHNVIPTSQGYQSCAYDSEVPALVSMPGNFDTCFPLYYTNPTARVLFSPGLGNNYIYDNSVGIWASINPFALGVINPTTIVTTAYVQGVTYICYQGQGVFIYNTTTKQITAVTISGITATNIIGICSALGYMIAWDSSNTIYWSAILNPTDFTPSVITGSGSSSPLGSNGAINFCVPIAGGFMVYCERNCVGASYSGNVNYPFVFKEVSGSGGVNTQEQVTFQSNQPIQYAWTTAGLQELNLTMAQNVFPEATEFLAKLIFEDFDETSLQLTTTYLTFPLYNRLSCVSNRYIILSYGITPVFTHALVFDLYLNRWGKLKISHIKAFEWNSPNPYGNITYGMLANIAYGQLVSTTYGNLNTSVNSTEQPLKNIAFMDQNGTISILNLDLVGATQTGQVADGVLIIGKFQMLRSRWITHQFAEIENVMLGKTFNYYVIPTVDGKTLVYPPVIGTLISQGTQVRKYGTYVKGQNVSMLMTGAFNLTSITFNFTIGGSK